MLISMDVNSKKENVAIMVQASYAMIDGEPNCNRLLWLDGLVEIHNPLSDNL